MPMIELQDARDFVRRSFPEQKGDVIFVNNQMILFFVEQRVLCFVENLSWIEFVCIITNSKDGGVVEVRKWHKNGVVKEISFWKHEEAQKRYIAHGECKCWADNGNPTGLSTWENGYDASSNTWKCTGA